MISFIATMINYGLYLDCIGILYDKTYYLNNTRFYSGLLFFIVFFYILSKQLEHKRCPFFFQKVFVDLSISFLHIKHLNIGDILIWNFYIRKILMLLKNQKLATFIFIIFISFFQVVSIHLSINNILKHWEEDDNWKIIFVITKKDLLLGRSFGVL